MITYQVKIKISEPAEKKWLVWMKTRHVPDMIATGLIKSYQILKSDSEKNLYLFHYHFASRRDFETYQRDFAHGLKAHPAEMFEGQFTAEREIFQWV